VLIAGPKTVFRSISEGSWKDTVYIVFEQGCAQSSLINLKANRAR